jgi:hypothetical protein
MAYSECKISDLPSSLLDCGAKDADVARSPDRVPDKHSVNAACAVLATRASTPRFPATSSLDSLQSEVGRIFRSLAIGYGKSHCIQVKTVKQRFTLTEENRYRHEVKGVDQSSCQILSYR